MRAMPNVLITGGYGCIGAETAKWLVNNTASAVVIGSRRVSSSRSQRVFHDVDSGRIRFIELDVSDADRLWQVLCSEKVTHVAHLAALQTPDCNAHRDLGLQINLAGTQNLIEAMKASQLPLQKYVFASSIAVYGPRAQYAAGRVPMLAPPNPVNVYGVWKLAGEQISRFFHEDTGVGTVCLRPGVLFGPGRDAGLTASPTTAIKCLALGIPYQIPFGSRQDYLFAPDVGAAFGHALLDPFDGYGVFTLPSRTIDSETFVTELRFVAAEMGLADRFSITVGDQQVPFICDLDSAPFQSAFPRVPLTELRDALRRSLQVFLDQVRRGWLTADQIRR